MSRTHRNPNVYVPQNFPRVKREALRALGFAEWPLHHRPALRGGNMVMSDRVSGEWGKMERYPSGKRKSTGAKKDAERRNSKRSERQNIDWKGMDE